MKLFAEKPTKVPTGTSSQNHSVKIGTFLEVITSRTRRGKSTFFVPICTSLDPTSPRSHPRKIIHTKTNKIFATMKTIRSVFELQFNTFRTRYTNLVSSPPCTCHMMAIAFVPLLLCCCLCTYSLVPSIAVATPDSYCAGHKCCHQLPFWTRLAPSLPTSSCGRSFDPFFQREAQLEQHRSQ